MRYQSFRLQIVPGPAGGYAVQALSPCGEGRAPFFPPNGQGDKQEGNRPPEAVGESLFRALFRDEILRLYERSLDLLAKEPAAGLRLELMLDPRDPGLAALQALPWELMRQPGTPELLALSRRLPIVRYLAVPRPVYAARRPAVLRILAVAASPRSQPPLDLARERRLLQKAVGSAGGSPAKIEILEPEAPTLASLRQALLDHECHVLHFMGHGGMTGAAGAAGERVLLFETEDGGEDPVRGTDLVNKLADFPTLRLAVLNACESASLPEETRAERFDPFAGVAVSLVMGGLPAVVAMRLEVSDQAAIAFSRAFYQRLAAGDPVDAAVAEGRQAVHSAHAADFEWAAPVLFMRTPNGEIFPQEDIPPEHAARKRWPRRAAAALLALTLLGVVGLTLRDVWVERLVARGVELAQHGQWGQAHKKFIDAVKLAPSSAEVRSNLAASQEQLGFLSSAEKNYRRAVSLRPESADHLYNLGYFLNGRQNYQEAYKYLDSAVKRNPKWVDAYGELAAAAFHLGLLDEAREALTAALKLDSERPALQLRLGEVELSAKRPKAAISSLKSALLRTPLGDRRRIETTGLLVQAYDQLGNRAMTCREIDEFERLEAVATPWAPQVDEIADRNGCKAIVKGD